MTETKNTTIQTARVHRIVKEAVKEASVSKDAASTLAEYLTKEATFLSEKAFGNTEIAKRKKVSVDDVKKAIADFGCKNVELN